MVMYSVRIDKQGTVPGRLQRMLSPVSSLVLSICTKIMPVIDYWQLSLESGFGCSQAVNLNTTAGTVVVVATVPEGERWYLYNVGRDSTTAGTHVLLKRKGVVVSVPTVMPETMPLTSFYTTTAGNINHQGGVIAEPGDVIGMYSNATAGDAARTCWFEYLIDKAVNR